MGAQVAVAFDVVVVVEMGAAGVAGGSAAPSAGRGLGLAVAPVGEVEERGGGRIRHGACARHGRAASFNSAGPYGGLPYGPGSGEGRAPRSGNVGHTK